jgi:DNA-3-methyladenine glycosylase
MRGTPVIVPRSFYARPTLLVARELVGKVLVRRSREGATSGKIVEVEAYIGEDDPACHAAPGPTPRNQPLYGDPGHAYVYFNYGVHDMFNVVTEPRGMPAAILVRALEPIEGIELMRRRRAAGVRLAGLKTHPAARHPHADAALGAAAVAPASRAADRREIPIDRLCRGPGNLTRAMGITRRENRVDLCGAHLFIEDRGLEVGKIAWSPRIGINVGVERRWRCYVVGSKAVSGRRA